MTKFEVAIYNETVRKLLNEGRRHRNLSDDWAEVHYFDIEAETADEARNKLARKYPSDLGYVIDSVEARRY